MDFYIYPLYHILKKKGTCHSKNIHLRHWHGSLSVDRRPESIANSIDAVAGVSGVRLHCIPPVAPRNTTQYEARDEAGSGRQER
jgi:hypothetical protein